MLKKIRQKADEWEYEFFRPIYNNAAKLSSIKERTTASVSANSGQSSATDKQNTPLFSDNADTVDSFQVGYISTRSNIMPENLLWGQVRCINGHIIRYAHHGHKNESSLGTVVIVADKGDYIEKYYETIRELIERNFSVICFDNPGDGMSPIKIEVFKEKGMDIYIDALRAVMKTVAFTYYRRPYFLFSVGARCITSLQYMHAYRDNFMRAIMISPLFNMPIKRKPYIFHKSIFLLKSYLFPHLSAKSDMHYLTINTTHDFNTNIYTHDLIRFQRCITPMQKTTQLSDMFFTREWFIGFGKALKKFKKSVWYDNFRITVLFICAEKDVIQPYKITQKIAHYMRQAGFVKIPFAKRDILNENDAIRAHFWHAFDNFIPGYNKIFNKKSS